MTQKKHNWLLYAIITMLTWGVWMTFSDPTLGDTYLGIPKNFPSEMVYVIWAISMIPCAIFALFNIAGCMKSIKCICIIAVAIISKSKIIPALCIIGSTKMN